MNTQREVIYAQRKKVLDGEDLRDNMLSMLRGLVESNVTTALADHGGVATEEAVAQLLRQFEGIYFLKGAYAAPAGYQGYSGYQGIVGARGTQGDRGLQGPTGYQGYKGAQGNANTTYGPQGPTGYQGYKGVQGKVGAQGPQGNTGAQGPTGYQGYKGPQGGANSTRGLQGPTGYQGYAGVQGSRGAQGPQGPTGTQGNTGYQGFKGAQGNANTVRGPQGPTGYQGYAGVQGARGSQGPQGNTGAQGPTGYQGYKGAQGGANSTRGPQGPTGYQGYTGYQGIVGARGTQGDRGAQGPAGYQGYTGAQGVQGPRGAQGPTGARGPTGAQGPAATGGATGGTGGTGAAGGTGATGPTGPTGAAGQNYIGPTGATGSVASISTSGSGNGVKDITLNASTKVLTKTLGNFISYDSVGDGFYHLSQSDLLYRAALVKDVIAGAPGSSNIGSSAVNASTGLGGPFETIFGKKLCTNSIADINGNEWNKGSNTQPVYFANGVPVACTANFTGPKGPTGATGPTGAASTVRGPQGPTGATGPTGPAGSSGSSSIKSLMSLGYDSVLTCFVWDVEDYEYQGIKTYSVLSNNVHNIVESPRLAILTGGPNFVDMQRESCSSLNEHYLVIYNESSSPLAILLTIHPNEARYMQLVWTYDNEENFIRIPAKSCIELSYIVQPSALDGRALEGDRYGLVILTKSAPMTLTYQVQL